MSRLGINTGNSPNDGQGDPLRVAMGKINSNFIEIYNTLGDGNTVTSYASTAGISTLARNLTNSPIINVSGVSNTGVTTTEHLEVRNITSIGVVTATQFVGDGSQLTNVTALVGGLEVLDDNVRKGVARELNFGANIVSTGPDGVGRVTISVSNITASSTYASIAGIATESTVSGYASIAGVSTVAFGITGTPNIRVGVVTADSYNGSGARLTGVITSLVAGTNISILQSAGIATVNAFTIGDIGAFKSNIYSLPLPIGGFETSKSYYLKENPTLYCGIGTSGPTSLFEISRGGTASVGFDAGYFYISAGSSGFATNTGASNIVYGYNLKDHNLIHDVTIHVGYGNSIQVKKLMIIHQHQFTTSGTISTSTQAYPFYSSPIIVDEYYNYGSNLIQVTAEVDSDLIDPPRRRTYVRVGVHSSMVGVGSSSHRMLAHYSIKTLDGTTDGYFIVQVSGI
jgi:hypothetical protein